jgi:hypothetical protein
MAENKTRPNSQSVSAFLNGIENETRRRDARVVARLMRTATGKRARIWGEKIVGYGKYRYRYDSGREGENFMVGFSPRKSKMVLYIVPGFRDYADLLARLGKHKTGKSCLYINKLADVDLDVLATLIRLSIEHMRHKYA